MIRRFLSLFLILSPVFLIGQTIQPPVLSEESGFYSTDFYLKISHPDSTVRILFTIDGSDPKIENLAGKEWNYKTVYKTSPVDTLGHLLQDTMWTYEYSDSIHIYDRLTEQGITSQITTSVYNHFLPSGNVFKGRVIRVVAYLDNEYSPIITKNYYVTPDGTNRYTFPVISLSMDNDKMYGYEAGLNVPGVKFDDWRNENPTEPFFVDAPANYKNKSSSSEFQVHFSYIKEGQEILNHYTGFRLNGNSTLFYPNRAFRLYAKSDYGTKSFNTNFFEGNPHNKFKRLILRNSGNDNDRTFFRDSYIQYLAKNLNFCIQESQPVILFINGEYDGIRNLRDKYDSKYFDRVFNISEDSLDYLENDGIVDEGDSIFYTQMMDFFKNNSLEDQSNYEAALNYLDPINFTDYYITNIFIANDDWPHNNNKYWRKRVPYDSTATYGHDGRFRWVLKDTDHGYDLSETNRHKLNMIKWVTRVLDASEPDAEFYNNSTLIMRKLLENESYKNYFINRFADLLNTTFTQERAFDIIEQFKNKYQPEIEENSLRWNNFSPVQSKWEEYVDVLNHFALNRPYYQRQHLIEEFNLDGLYDVFLDVSDTMHGYVHLNTIDILSTTDGINEMHYLWTGKYFKNVPIQFTPLAKQGYKFSHWSGEISDTVAVQNVTLNKDIYLKVNFVLKDTSDSLATHTNTMDDIKIFPNPFGDKINVLVDAYEGEYSVYSIEGRQLKHNTFNASLINLEDLPKGVFILEINTGKSVYRKQIIKQ